MALRPTAPRISGYSPSDQKTLMANYERKVADYNRQQAVEDEQAIYNRNLATSDFQYARNLKDQIAAENRALSVKRTTTTSNVMPSWSLPESYDVPKYEPYIPGAAPTYTAPTWDEGAIENLTQQKASGGLRELRSQVQRVTGRKYYNAQVGRMTLREALQGYGAGVGSVLSGAGNVARGEYGQKYGIEADVAKTNYGGAMSQWSAANQAKSEGAKTNYQAELERRRTGFQASWDKWKSSIGSSTTSTTR